MMVMREPESMVLPSTVTYAIIGVPTPMTRLARLAPMVRQVDSSARSLDSGETAEAMEP